MITLEYIRSFRVGPFAIFDTAASYLGILIFTPILKWVSSKVGLVIPIVSWLWFTLPISVVFHIMFRQSTPLMKILENPGKLSFYIAALLLVVMMYMGVSKIHKI